MPRFQLVFHSFAKNSSTRSGSSGDSSKSPQGGSIGIEQPENAGGQASSQANVESGVAGGGSGGASISGTATFIVQS